MGIKRRATSYSEVYVRVSVRAGRKRKPGIPAGGELEGALKRKSKLKENLAGLPGLRFSLPLWLELQQGLNLTTRESLVLRLEWA